MKKDVWKAWYQAGRVKFYIVTLIPLVLGGVIAANYGKWDTGLWLTILLASFLVHLNTNLANDYFEYFSGADEGDSIGGSRVLQEGRITLRQVRNVLIIFYLIALACGIRILLVTELWWLIAVMIFSFMSSLFYTAPPIRYGYHGMGELFVGINMGPVITAGTASALIGEVSLKALWLSAPIGIMVAFILYYQSLSDIDEDRAVGKNTFAVYLGRKNIIHGFRAFVIAAVLSVIVLVAVKHLHPAGLISIPTVLMLLKTDKLIRTAGELHELHDRGGPVRGFYLINGLILIIANAIWR